MNESDSSCMANVRARLDWARGHIDRFDAEVDVFLSGCSCVESVEEKIEWREPYFIRVVTYRAKSSTAVPMSPRLIAGDAIHSLRASVDNLVWGLGNIYDAKNSLSLFFSDTPTAFKKRARRAKLTRLPEDIQNWVEDQQIYNQVNGDASPLHKLNTLWNDDKHRVPALVSNASPSVYLGPRMVGHLDLVTVNTSDNGEVVITTEGEGSANPDFLIEVRFPEHNTNAIAFLRDTHKHICEDILPRFEPYFR